MPIYDACLDCGIGIVHTRHESAAVFMAEAYAQFSGAPGVALVTAAPGFANALGALYSAKQSETPVIFLSGDSPVANDGCGAFQEFDQTSAIKPFVKNSQRVTNIHDFRRQWHDSLQMACDGVPGPVHLALPFDIVNQTIEEVLTPSTLIQGDDDKTRGYADDVQAIYNFLAGAARPLVLLGPALCRPGYSELRQRFQKSTGMAPVCMESPRGLNDPVLGSFRTLCQQADRVLLLGKKPDFTVGFASKEIFSARFAVVIDGADNQQLVSNNLGERCDNIIKASAASFIEQFCDYTELNAGEKNAKQQETLPLADNQQWHREVENCLGQRPDTPAVLESQPCHPAQIAAAVEQAMHQLGRETSADSIESQPVLICDGGEFGQWAQAGTRTVRRMINGPSGAIGGSLACAVGAAGACPEAVIFVMLGDGTSGFYLAELETIAREQVPAVIIIGNDSRWNAEYQIQLEQYGEQRTHSCELPEGLRYDKVAQGLGMLGELITSVSALDTALLQAVEQARVHRQATLLNVIMQGHKAPVYG